MFIIQHIWTKWTKRSRGADAPLKRPRLAACYPLPAFGSGADVVQHEIRALEAEDFAVIETFGATTRDDWPRLQPYRDNALDWRLRGNAVEIVLVKPSQGRQQTKWPAELPRPLFTLRPRETARIEWNGRFISSLSGANRATYFEQHIYWLAVAEAPSRDLFLTAEPRKAIDLTTGIY